MKRFRTKIAISILTFAIGIFAVAVWLVKFKSDSNIYLVEFSKLIKESKIYDGKIVEIQVSYVQGYEATFLTDSNHRESITVTCLLGKNLAKRYLTCYKILQKDKKKSL